jgi:hypothetical protein
MSDTEGRVIVCTLSCGLLIFLEICTMYFTLFALKIIKLANVSSAGVFEKKKTSPFLIFVCVYLKKVS